MSVFELQEKCVPQLRYIKKKSLQVQTEKVVLNLQYSNEPRPFQRSLDKSEQILSKMLLMHVLFEQEKGTTDSIHTFSYVLTQYT